MEQITILQCAETGYAAKRFEQGADGEVFPHEVRLGKFFLCVNRSVNGFADLSVALSEIENDGSKFIIRGEPASNIFGSPIRRLSKSSSTSPATFKHKARRWCMLDIDGIEAPRDLELIPENAHAILSHTIRLLPKEFQGVDCWYQFSASMAVKPGIRVHLWFWLDRQVDDLGMKRWLSGSPADLALFQAVQPHFTARPEFINGATDPFTNRSGVYRAECNCDVVKVPEDATAALSERSSKGSNAERTGTGRAQYVTRDPETGLVVDGRERYLLQCSNEAMTVSLRKSGKQASLDKVASLTWELFERSVDNTDGKWSADDAAREARRRLEEFKSGTWTFSGSNKEDILYPVDEPYHKPLVVEREVGLKQLEHHLSAFFSDGEGPKRLALRITMGAGKTHRTIEHLKQSLTSSFNRRVEIYVPYHSLAAEYEQKLLAEGSRVNARVVHVFPRTGGSRGDLPVMCGRADHVRALEEAELPVFKHACRSDTDGESCVQRCPLYDHCGYIQQFADPPIDELNGNVVRIFAHNYLSLPRNPIQRDPDTVIIDEAFVTGLAKAVRVRRAHLSQLIRTVSFPRLGKLIGEALEEGRPVLDVLRDEGVAEVDLRAVEKDIRETLTHVPFGANAVSISNDEIPRRRAVTALRLLREELGLSDRKRAERVTYDPVKDDVVLCVGSEVEVPDDANLLVLDATADEQLLEKAVGPVEFHRIDIRQRAWVTQVYDRTGSNTFWNNNLDEVGNLIRVVNAWAEIGEKPLVVGHKALCDYLREHDGLHAEVIVAHFMSLRGSNAAKECTVAFIAGRNQPPSATVDEMARALFWADDEPLFHDEATQRVQTDRRAKKGGFLPVQLRGFLNAENGPREQHGVMVHAFSDARIEAIHAQMREAETVQAVARLRLVHAEAMKRVFLLSNLPVEIPVHRLCKFDELMPDPLELALLKKGNVPLTPLGLRKMRPDLHPSSEAAKKALQRSVLGREDQLRMLPSLMRSGCVVVRFKARNNNRLKEHKHLFLLHGGEAKQEIPGLSERVGRVPFSEWVEFLRRGDPALPDTGWGEVLDPSMEWLPMMS